MDITETNTLIIDSIPEILKSELFFLDKKSRTDMFKLKLITELSVAKKKSILYFTNGISTQDLVLKILYSHSNIDLNEKISHDDFLKLLNNNESLSDVSIYFYEDKLIETKEITKQTKLSSINSFDLIIIDNLNEVAISKNTSNENSNSLDILKALKTISQELDIPIIILNDKDTINSFTDDYEDEFLLHIYNLSKKCTGLSTGAIQLSNARNKYGSIVKFYRRLGKDELFSIINVSKSPTILEDDLRLKQKERSEVFQFIILNYDLLMEFWHEGEGMITDYLLESIEKI